MATQIIDNFSGALTRNNYGSMNSGLAKYNTSFGYNPFYKPGQLTWLKDVGNATALISSGLALAGTSRVESGTLVTYVITSTGHLYRLLGEGTGGSDIRTLSTGSPTFTYGADIEFYGVGNTLYISHDLGVTKITIDAAGAFVSEAQIGTWSATQFTPITTRRSMAQINGLLYVINSDPSVTYANNIAEISTAGIVNTYAKLSPSLPAGTYIRDLDVAPDLTYLVISSSIIPSELLAPVNDTTNVAAAVSGLYMWNGIDAGGTTGQALPSYGVTAMQSFGGKQMMFSYDTFGAAVWEGSRKILTLRNQKSPMPGATSASGNFLTWVAPEYYYNLDSAAGSMNGSLFYYGRLDEGSPVGLWRMVRQSSLIGGSIYQMPFQLCTSSRFTGVNTSGTPVIESNGVHVFSFVDYTGAAGSTVNNYFFFQASPPDDSAAGWTGAMAGVYETQTEMFSHKQQVKQIRVYCEPTKSGNGFNIDLIGVDGKKMTNGSFSYTYSAGTDITKLQGALDRINFNSTAIPTYAVGIRITNTGSLNMCIPKIEVDYEPSGK